MNRIIIITIIFLVSCSPSKELEVVSIEEIMKPSVPKNIIFLIGDGMGLSQITMGMYSQGNETVFERFPIVGLHKSHSSSSLITDSAAGATAFSIGKKTYNGAIGVDSDTISQKTILEFCQERKMNTGLVASSTIVHATPASFASHNRYRKNYEELALDLSDSEVDILIGGGKKFFVRRKDDRNLMKEMEANGYVAKDFFDTELSELEVNSSQKFIYLTSDEDPIPVAMGRDYLPLASRMAINHLDGMSDNGFFIMIEGSQIDWGGHANNRDYIITEYQEFDGIIQQALDFATKDGETLVLVTADHETGGLALNPGSRMDSINAVFTTGYHTASMIPVFAYGPGAEEFSGVYENTEIFNKLLYLLKHKGIKID